MIGSTFAIACCNSGLASVDFYDTLTSEFVASKYFGEIVSLHKGEDYGQVIYISEGGDYLV
jgi:hypothetical protein